VNGSDFRALLAHTHQTLQDLTDTKGVEYSNSTDQLANFKRLAANLGVAPEFVVLVYLTKHLDSINSFVANDGELSEPIFGRIDDAILYLVLLKACIFESAVEGRV
jgi:hypothetical protein